MEWRARQEMPQEQRCPLDKEEQRDPPRIQELRQGGQEEQTHQHLHRHIRLSTRLTDAQEADNRRGQGADVMGGQRI